MLLLLVSQPQVGGASGRLHRLERRQKYKGISFAETQIFVHFDFSGFIKIFKSAFLGTRENTRNRRSANLSVVGKSEKDKY